MNVRAIKPRRPYRGLQDPCYPFHDKTVVVTNCGRLCLYRKKINLSTCLAGQAVGIKEVDDGIWLVSFMDYDLGFVDLKEKTLQPLPNPFGPKVLPMCPDWTIEKMEREMGLEPTTSSLGKWAMFCYQ